jgi:hypothetical protein
LERFARQRIIDKKSCKAGHRGRSKCEQANRLPEAAMDRRWGVVFLFFASMGWCQQNSAPSLTIYNQNLAVVGKMFHYN